MAEILLTSERFVKSVTAISDNLEGKYLQGAIREAGDIYLENILGSSLLSALKEMVADGTIEEPANAAYKDLLNMAQYFLAYTAAVHVLQTVDYKIANAGVVKTPDQNVVTATDEERDRQASSILFVKGASTRTYPVPPYAAAIKSCEIERCIDDFHLTSIDNGFAPSALVNLNNGVPTDAEKAEITEDFAEKYQGATNAGRVVFIFNETKENAATIDTVSTEDFGARYEALSKHSRQAIFTAFRANPNLFGIPTESLGFSQEEYESSFRLYNRTVVRPAQRRICDAYDKIYGVTGAITIRPFSIDEEQVTEQIVK